MRATLATSRYFCTAVVTALERGRDKQTNVYVWGGIPNCGKTFLTQPLALIFVDKCFENPEAGAFPFTARARPPWGAWVSHRPKRQLELENARRARGGWGGVFFSSGPTAGAYA